MATKITVNNNGSLRVEGDVEIFDASGNQFGLGGRSVIGLCRCGQSANKPFCDGSLAVASSRKSKPKTCPRLCRNLRLSCRRIVWENEGLQSHKL